ncbi:MAG: hypothetical protein LKJ90_10045 [Faecalibacterium sp.]|jgi:hypothetical protein|nr:hypothetical protein [Faecalibacterium sp.]
MDMASAAVWISLAACITSILGLLFKQGRRNEEDALWRGEVNGKLDVVCGIKQDVEELKEACQQNARNIAVVDASTKSAHHRIDELAREPYRPRKA